MNEQVECRTLVRPLTAGQPERIRACDMELAALRSDGWHYQSITMSTVWNQRSCEVEVTQVIVLVRPVRPSVQPEPCDCEETAFINELLDLEDRREPLPVDAPVEVPVMSAEQTAADRIRARMRHEHKPRRTARAAAVPKVTAPRKPIEEVGFAEAFASGQYSNDELKEIGNREARQAGLRVFFERQQNRGDVWTGFLNRLPQRVTTND